MTGLIYVCMLNTLHELLKHKTPIYKCKDNYIHFYVSDFLLAMTITIPLDIFCEVLLHKCVSSLQMQLIQNEVSKSLSKIKSLVKTANISLR